MLLAIVSAPEQLSSSETTCLHFRAGELIVIDSLVVKNRFRKGLPTISQLANSTEIAHFIHAHRSFVDRDSDEICANLFYLCHLYSLLDGETDPTNP